MKIGGQGNNKFWAVWRLSGGATPNKRHNSKDVAIAEAGRLAQQTSESYYVLEAIGIVGIPEAPVTYTELAVEHWDRKEKLTNE